MKIAVFTDAFLPQTNGMVTHLIESLPILAKNHQIIIFAANQKGINLPVTFTVSKIETVFLPSLPLPIYQNWRISLPYYLRVNKILKAFNPGLIHFHSPFTIAANGIIYAKKNKIPLVGSFHGYFMEPEYLTIIGLDKLGLHQSKIVNKILWQYSNLFYNQATRVICPSEATKKDLISHRVKPPIDVISNGINLVGFQTKKTDKNYHLPEKYLLYVGRVSREKNIDLVIKAFAKLTETKYNDVSLMIVGDGPDKKRLIDIATDLKINHKIVWLGNIDHQQLISSNIYQQAICFISASTSETQGITFLEAMAYGLALIGVAAKAVPELINNNGIICQVNDIDSLVNAANKLISNPDLRKKYQQQSLKLIQKHDISHTISKLNETYKRLLVKIRYDSC